MFRIFLIICIYILSLSASNWHFSELYQGKKAGRTSGEHFAVVADGHHYIFYGYYHLYCFDYNGTDWSQYIIDNSDNVGSYSSAVKDSNNFLHVVYRDKKNNILKYSTNRSGQWKSHSLGSVSYGKASILIDSSNQVHIFYIYNSNLRHVYTSNNIWQPYESIASGAYHLSAGIDADDVFHLVYLNYDRDNIHYMYKNANSWNDRVIASLINDKINEIVFDIYGNNASGTKAIAFYMNDGKTMLYKTDVSNYANLWTGYLINAGTLATSSQLALEVLSNTSITLNYYDKDEYKVKKASYNSASDTFESISSNIDISYGDNLSMIGSLYAYFIHNNILYQVINAGRDEFPIYKRGKIPVISSTNKADIVASDSGVIHATFHTEDDIIWYLVKKNSVWKKVQVTAQKDTIITPPAIALNSAQNPFILYADYSKLVLLMSVYGFTNELPIWLAPGGGDGVIASSTSRLGSPKMAYDIHGYLHVIYIDTADDKLYHMVRRDALWSSEEVDSGVSLYCSLALDSTGGVHIAYTKGNATSNVYYATNETSTWNIRNIDANNNNSKKRYPIIKVDSRNNIHIAFYDENQNSDTIRYIKGSVLYSENGILRFLPIESSLVKDLDTFTRKISLILDKNDQPNLYYTLSNNKLLHSYKENANFKTQESTTNYNLGGISAVRTKSETVLLSPDYIRSSMIEGASSNSNSSPAVIMYLLN
jgi:hypothetical protein